MPQDEQYAKLVLSSVRVNKGIQGEVADKFREAAAGLAKRNPSLTEARYFLDEEEVSE